MSSFSRFVKQLPFPALPQRFRRQKPATETIPAVPAEQELQGITINVYELEVQEDGSGGDDEHKGSEEPSNNLLECAEEDEVNDGGLEGAELTSGWSMISSHQLRYANITVVCSKCNGQVPVSTLQNHRRRHQALQTLKYSTELPPMTTRGLLRRRNKAVSEVMQGMAFEQEGQFIRVIQKINVAFELLKAELLGTNTEQTPNVGRWKEKEIRAEGRILNRSLTLGVSRYGKADHSSLTKYVYVDDFLKSCEGLFLGIYQAYNGNYIAQLCVRELHKDIQRNLQRVWDVAGLSVDDIRAIFQAAYRRIDRIQLLAEGETSWTRWSGCSAVTCLLVKDTLYVANEGNLRGLLIRENNTVREVTSAHDLYNRKERARVRRRHGVIVKTEKCALVNGVLATTRGLGNQGDWRLKVCVINKPTFRALDLRERDRMLVLASEGLWKVFSHREVLCLLNKFIRDAVIVEGDKAGLSKTSMTPDGQNLLGVCAAKTMKHDTEFRSFAKHLNKGPVDFSVPEKVVWSAHNPQIFVRKASVIIEEPLSHDSPASTRCKSDSSRASESGRDDDDSQELARVIGAADLGESLSARREISRLLSKRLLKSALIAGADVDNVALVLLLRGFQIESKKTTAM